MSGHVAVLKERVTRLEAENALLRTRLLRMPARRRPRYRGHERLEILWHAARYRFSVTATARTFAVTRQTVIHWRGALRDKEPRLLPPVGRLPDLVRELVLRLKAEWPRWGTRRIAGTLARLGIKASRSSVQRILKNPRAPTPSRAIDVRFRRYARWHNRHRPHQGLGQHTPDDVYRGRPLRVPRTLSTGVLKVSFVAGDRRLPVLRLAKAA